MNKPAGQDNLNVYCITIMSDASVIVETANGHLDRDQAGHSARLEMESSDEKDLCGCIGGAES